MSSLYFCIELLPLAGDSCKTCTEQSTAEKTGHRLMMVSVLVPLLLVTVLLTFASLSPIRVELVSPCPPRWLLFGQKCFAFYPVWSSWSDAYSLCSQTGSNLVSLHTLEDLQFLRYFTNTKTNVSVWLGGYYAHQNDSWLWSDESSLSISDWANHGLGKTREDRACMEMEPKSGELHSVPCGELKFYICSASSRYTVFPISRKPVEPDIVPGVTLFDVVWGYSDLVAEEILDSSSFVRKLRNGQLTEKCYSHFIQQEALYLHRVSSTLQTLISQLEEAGEMRSVLLETVQHYSSRKQSLLALPPPEWLRLVLQAFHNVVLEEPVYWVVALLARATLRNFIAMELLRPDIQLISGSQAETVYQIWNRDHLREVALAHRLRKVIDDHQDKMDEFKAVNIFRTHMISQKALYKAVICDDEDDR